MATISPCLEPGCSTLCVGLLCIAHEPKRPDVLYPRGRPWPPVNGPRVRTPGAEPEAPPVLVRGQGRRPPAGVQAP